MRDRREPTRRPAAAPRRTVPAERGIANSPPTGDTPPVAPSQQTSALAVAPDPHEPVGATGWHHPDRQLVCRQPIFDRRLEVAGYELVIGDHGAPGGGPPPERAAER